MILPNSGTLAPRAIDEGHQIMAKRVNTGGPAEGDNPDEYWFECTDCHGEGVVEFKSLDEDGNPEEEHGECPGCDGLGYYEGDADDLDL